MSRKILITGGSGFIGRNLVEHLGQKYDLTSPDIGELNLLDAETVKNYLKTNDFDFVLHCANVGVNRKNPGPDNMVELNLRMFFNLEQCSEHFGRMIQFGSGAEYGKQANIHKAKEEDFGKRVPADSYGFAKYVCSKYIGRSDNITCLRIFGCYGKYEDYESRFISNAICRALYDNPIVILNKNVVFSYLYVDDLAVVIDAILKKKPKQKVYNVVPDETVDLVKISDIVNELRGRKNEVRIITPGIGLEYTGDNSRIRREFPAIKFTGIKEGVAALYKWYSKNLETVERGIV